MKQFERDICVNNNLLSGFLQRFILPILFYHIFIKKSKPECRLRSGFLCEERIAAGTKKKGMAETFLGHPFKLHFLQNLKQTGRMQGFILCKPCKHFRKSFVGCYLMSVSLIIAYKLGGILPSSEHSVSVCNLQMFFFVHALITSRRLLLS